MTSQEKIAQLALAALRSAPPPASPPKPAFFVPTYSPQPQAQPAPAAPVQATVVPVAVVDPPVVEAPPVAEAVVFKDEGDPAFRAEIEAREAVIAKKQSRQKWAVNLTTLAALITAGVWVANSPTALAKLKSLGPAMKQSVNDAKTLGTITDQYDKQLEKVKVHSSHLDDATRALGVDPASVPKDEDPNMESEMKQMTGGEKTTNDSARELQQKFGFASKLTGRDQKSAEEQKPAAGKSAPDAGPQ